MECVENLRVPARSYHVELNDEQLHQLSVYLDLLIKWNRAYNLTGTRRPDDLVTRHILDSLTVADHLRGDQVVDVGTGAGFPGIPLAVACPQMQFTLLDSNTKKTRFLHAVKSATQLKNITICSERMEQHTQRYQTVVCRALGKIAQIVNPVSALAEPGGRIVIMAGIAQPVEPGEQVELEAVFPVEPPIAREKRHLICLRKLY